MRYPLSHIGQGSPCKFSSPGPSPRGHPRSWGSPRPQILMPRPSPAQGEPHWKRGLRRCTPLRWSRTGPARGAGAHNRGGFGHRHTHAAGEPRGGRGWGTVSLAARGEPALPARTRTQPPRADFCGPNPSSRAWVRRPGKRCRWPGVGSSGGAARSRAATRGADGRLPAGWGPGPGHRCAPPAGGPPVAAVRSRGRCASSRSAGFIRRDRRWWEGSPLVRPLPPFPPLRAASPPDTGRGVPAPHSATDASLAVLGTQPPSVCLPPNFWGET